MENNLKKETVSKLKALGFYQIAGGIIGLLLTAWTILNLTGIEGVLLLIVSIAAALTSSRFTACSGTTTGTTHCN